jgi:hypothetical protein
MSLAESWSERAVGGVARVRASKVFLALAAAGVALCAAFVVAVTAYLLRGTAADGLPTRIEVACAVASPPCEVLRQDLGHGRWRVAVKGHGGEPVTIAVEPVAGAPPAGTVLLLRAGYDRFVQDRVAGMEVRVDGAPVEVGPVQAWRPGPRALIPLGEGRAMPLRIEAWQGGADAAKTLVLDEVGLFARAADVNTPYGLVRLTAADEGWAVHQMRRALYLMLILAFATAWSTSRAAPTLVGLACGAAIAQAALVLLVAVTGPEWTADMRALVGAGTLLEPPGSNLNYGLGMAHGVVSGVGPLANGQVLWNRMPGYAYLVAAAGPWSGAFELGVRSLAMHLVVLAVGLAALVPAMARLAPLPVAALAGMAIAVAPATPWYTFIESLMPGVACLLLAAGCRFAAAYEEKGYAPWPHHLALHLAFAFWFAVRTDIVPAWALVSLLLYAPRRKDWPKLAYPVVLFLAVGLPWALFKQRITGEFNMTTSSFGASFMVGMWDAPNPFVWTPLLDGTYFGWMEQNGRLAASMSAAGSSWATGEVLRFMLVYPMHVVALALNDFVAFVWRENAPGVEVLTGVNYRGWPTLLAIGVGLVALAVWYRPTRLLLVGSILVFNTTIFFLTYSQGGRFYNTAVPAMIVLIAVFLGDAKFWSAALAKPVRAALAIALTLLVGLHGETVAQASLSDRFRYSFSILDPASSTLVRFARPLELGAPAAAPAPAR